MTVANPSIGPRHCLRALNEEPAVDRRSVRALGKVRHGGRVRDRALALCGDGNGPPVLAKGVRGGKGRDNDTTLHRAFMSSQ
jgi:hypothetical protein